MEFLRKENRKLQRKVWQINKWSWDSKAQRHHEEINDQKKEVWVNETQIEFEDFDVTFTVGAQIELNTLYIDVLTTEVGTQTDSPTLITRSAQIEHVAPYTPLIV